DAARRHAPLLLRHETHDGEGGDRLSTAGLADQSERLVAVERERDAVDGRIPLRTNAKFGPKIFDTQYRFAHEAALPGRGRYLPFRSLPCVVSMPYSNI